MSCTLTLTKRSIAAHFVTAIILSINLVPNWEFEYSCAAESPGISSDRTGDFRFYGLTFRVSVQTEQQYHVHYTYR